MSTERHQPLVYVVDDDAACRDMLARLLASVHLEARPCATGAEFLDSYDPTRPGCAVVDVRLPDQSGLAVLERLLDRDVRPPMIVISGHADVPMAVQALKLGAVDLLEKPIRNQELVDAVQRALARDLDEREDRAQRDAIAARLDSLTPREHEVLQHVVSGLPNKAIADELGLSTKTVEFHRSHLMHKMEAGSLAELVCQVLAVRDTRSD